MFCCRKMILRSLTGPVHRDPSEDVEMDEDDQRDYEDYNYQPQEDDEDSDFRLQRLVQVLVDSMESPLMNWNLQCILSRRPVSACLTLERP